MIIMTQDQKTLLPIGAVEKIFIHKVNEKYCLIRAQIREADVVTLGLYSSADRVTEVFNDIAETYEKGYTRAGIATSNAYEAPTLLNPPRFYRMPEDY